MTKICLIWARPRIVSRISGASSPPRAGLHVVDRLVDDVVVAQVDAVGLRLGGRLRLGLHVEAEHDRVGRRGQHDVALVDGADRAVDDLQLDLVGARAARATRATASTEPCTSASEDEPQLLDLARLDLLVQPLQRDARGRLDLEPCRGPARMAGDLPGLALVGDRHQHVAGRRHARQARGARPDPRARPA